MLIIGSHVGFRKDSQLLGSLNEALSYDANTFMIYTGAPQNTSRAVINDELTCIAIEKMKEENINIDNIIVHAPYIINLANKNKIDQYNFSINFLLQECKRCEELNISKLVLHPGSHVGIGIKDGINNIAEAINKVLPHTNTMILLETMAGKGTEIGSKLEEIKDIIDLTNEKEKLGICLDTCHLSDAGYDISDFDNVIKELERLEILNKVKCIHINDSKNIKGSHKDRHENIGFGELGFDNLIKIIYHEKFIDVPKILETPYVDIYPPYKHEIDMIRKKEFDIDLKENIKL